MRLILKTTKNKELIPFNYQSKLVSCVHKWLGRDNVEHGKVSLYSFSWLMGTIANRVGLNLQIEGKWFISAYDDELLKDLIQGIQKDPYMFCGIEVKEVTIQQTPEFPNTVKFSVANPVFIKRNLEDRKTKFYYSSDAEADEYLTQSLRHKLELAELDFEGATVAFDKDYPNPKIKGYEYNNIFNKGTICPVVVSGTPEQVAFAWNVGVGNSTGIGFGALI